MNAQSDFILHAGLAILLQRWTAYQQCIVNEQCPNSSVYTDSVVLSVYFKV